MPPSRNDLWLVLIIAGLCATAAGFVYFNNHTRATNRVLRQQTTSLISQLEELNRKVEYGSNQTRLSIAHSSELKDIIRQIGTLLAAGAQSGMLPQSTISTQDVISLRPLDAVRTFGVNKGASHTAGHISFVTDTSILKYLGRRKQVDGIPQVEINGSELIDFGCTNYFDLLSEGIIPLRINGVPLKTELRIDAAR